MIMTVAAFLLLQQPIAAAEPTVLLVEAGRPRAVLVLPAEAHEMEKLVADELREHVEKMSGAKLQVVAGEPPAGMLPVRIGASLSPDEAARLSAKCKAPGAMLLSVDAAGVRLVGNSPEGTLYAAYELLERLGCRWYLPGDLGAVIPRTKTVSIAAGQVIEEPSFGGRHLQNVSDDLPWARRARFGGPYFPGSHGISLLPAADIEKEPELFALVNGKRQDSQLCISNPEVLRRAIAAALAKFDAEPDLPWIGMGPRDTGGYCECEDCMKLDSGAVDPITGRRWKTDRYVWFFNRVLEGVHRKYPGKKICFYAYDHLKFPPEKFKPNAFLVPAFAPITQCRIHGINNPVCPDREMYKKTILEWTRLLPETYERGYYFNLACPAFPFSKIHAIREETPFAFQCGVKGWRVETKASWVSNGPSLYVASRLMWDAHADVDALLAEFYEKFFGPAGEPMGKYLEMVDHAFRDTDCHAGCSYCMPKVFTRRRMARMTEFLDEARRLSAGDADPLYAERVRLFRVNHDRLACFLEMLDLRNRFDFRAANESLDRLFELTDALINYRLYPPDQPKEKVSDIPYKVRSEQAWAINSSVAPSYINRFWAPTTRSGYARTVVDGDYVAGAPDEWDFLIDPTDVGEALGWHRDGKIGGNWQRMPTRTSTWSDQGLHYYKGLAWYRTQVRVPEVFRGRKVYLWFGGVDERAKVWLNGQLLGQSDEEGGNLVATAGTFKPFEFDVTEAVRFGQSNTIAVRITNLRLNEIGTGGITAPVMFWSPKEKAQ